MTMNRGVDPMAIPAILAMILLFVCAVCWLLRGFPLMAFGWIITMAVPYLLLRWGRS